MKNLKLFLDLKALPAQMLLVVAKLGPVRAKEVFIALQKKRFPVSYKAIVKRLNKMQQEGLLTKDELRFSVNRVWIEETKEKLDDLIPFRQ